MRKAFWKVSEITKIFNVDEKFIIELEKEKIISPVYKKKKTEKIISLKDMERLRMAKILMHEMDVNIPGVEVILKMHQNMIDMRKQFDNIFEDMAKNVKKELKKKRKTSPLFRVQLLNQKGNK